MKLLTLQDIIRNYDLESMILKMDCEGCEYRCNIEYSARCFEKFYSFETRISLWL